ncbi:hypothetical protein IWW48_004613 [Coemansia sp. RSA 1200]|nr:hypothetical protein IWW48_004613 [Coemansia sp. RSA 1200]
MRDDMTEPPVALPRASSASTHSSPTSSYSQQLYPAPRTANVFSLPFDRLSEPIWTPSLHSSLDTATDGDVPEEPSPSARRKQHYFLLRDQKTSESLPLFGSFQNEGNITSAGSAHSTAALMAATAEALDCTPGIRNGAPHALPRPLRTLSFWCGTSGPRKCIIYLEPRRTSPLYAAIEEFLRKSAQLFGPTEAHQYHPHSSMTGFIDVVDGPDLADNGSGDATMTSGQLITKIACHIHAFVASTLDSATTHAQAQLQPQMQARQVPTFRSVETVQDYPHKGTHKVQVTLDTPEAFRSIIGAIQTAVPQARIRGKRMGHISLSYYNKHVKTDKAITADAARSLSALAQSLFLCDPRVLDPALNHWDIAFYELASKSSSLSIPHRFNQIARWRL